MSDKENKSQAKRSRKKPKGMSDKEWLKQLKNEYKKEKENLKNDNNRIP